MHFVTNVFRTGKNVMLKVTEMKDDDDNDGNGKRDEYEVHIKKQI